MEMRLFFKKLGCFLAVTFVCFAIIDGGFCLFMYKASYRPVSVLKNILKGDINADVLVMGNSRAWTQIDPMALDTVLNVNSYNIGLDGSQINRQIQVYNLYRLHNPDPPRLIIQNIDAFSLRITNKYEIERFFPFLWMPSFRREIISNVSLPFKVKYLPLVRFRGIRIRHIIKNIQGNNLYKGFRASRIKGADFVKRKLPNYEFCVDDGIMEMFDSYLAKCRDEGIQLIFVQAPMYFKGKNAIAGYQEMLDTYQSFANKYDIPILDYSDMWICRDSSYFYNSMHITKEGAEIYSDSLSHNIKNLLRAKGN